MLTGMQDAVKVMAKSLIRNRHAVTKLYALKSQLQAVSLRIQVRRRRCDCCLCLHFLAFGGAGAVLVVAAACATTEGLALLQTLKSTQAMADAMKGATRVRRPAAWLTRSWSQRGDERCIAWPFTEQQPGTGSTPCCNARLPAFSLCRQCA